MNFLINLQCSQRRKWQQNTDGYPECHLNAAANAAEDHMQSQRAIGYPFCVCYRLPIRLGLSRTVLPAAQNHHALKKGGFEVVTTEDTAARFDDHGKQAREGFHHIIIQ